MLGLPSANPRPRWLHVLLPPEQEQNIRAAQELTPSEKQLAAIRKVLLDVQQETHSRLEALAVGQRKLDLHVGSISREVEGLAKGQNALYQEQRKLDESMRLAESNTTSGTKHEPAAGQRSPGHH